MPRKVLKQVIDAAPSMRWVGRDDMESTARDLQGMLDAIDAGREATILAARAEGTETDVQRSWLHGLGEKRAAREKALRKRDRYRAAHNGMDKHDYRRSLMTTVERQADDERSKRELADLIDRAAAFSCGAAEGDNATPADAAPTPTNPGGHRTSGVRVTTHSYL